MKSYTASRNLYGSLTGNVLAANLTLGDVLINEYTRQILSSHDWPFLEKQGTIDTVDSQQFYDLPYDYKKLINVNVTVSTQKYTPTEVPNRIFWDRLNMPTSTESDTPEYFFIQGRTLGFYPTPSSSGNTITYNYRPRIVDLSVADITTSTIKTVANGGTTVTAVAAAFTLLSDSPANQRWIRITKADTLNTGDGVFYEVDSITSTTVLELKEPYNGDAITAGTAAYTLIETSLIPEDFQTIPVHLAVADYWRKEKDFSSADRWEQKAKNDLAEMKKEFGEKSSNPVSIPSVFESNGSTMHNPNLFVSDLG